MNGKKQKHRKDLNGLNYLEMTPVQVHPHKVSENGLVTILIPKVTSKWGRRYLLPLMRYQDIKLNLDAFGSATWLLMDGQTNVSQICDRLVIQFGDPIQPAVERVTKFMSQLYVHKLITFREISA